MNGMFQPIMWANMISCNMMVRYGATVLANDNLW